jgi:protein-L-isoaspartate(D-aspartate) O-methyltransferase
MSDAGARAPKFPLRLDRVGAAGSMGTGASSSSMLRPQAPVRHAFESTSRRDAPSGLGLDSADVRRRMVDRLRAGGVSNEPLLAALSAVPRHLFVDAALVTQAYEDTSLPIGLGQTISKPSVVARMIELLLQGENARRSAALGRTLEIGTGCGYQAAVLAQLAQQVVSIERLKPLHDKARTFLAPLRLDRVRLVFGDGMRGHPPNAPYDSIIAAAGGESLPQAWLDQLAVGGRLVCPLHEPARHRQVLVVVDRHENGFEHRVHEPVRFVPLKSGAVG